MPMAAAPTNESHTVPAVIPAGRLAAIALASVAAGVHLVLIAQQAEVWWGYGVLMAAIAIAQIGIAVALVMRPTEGTILTAITVTVASTILYVISRTSGLPFGPGPAQAARFSDPFHAGHPDYAGALLGRAEPVGALDLGCLVAEVALVVLLVSLLPQDRRRRVTNALCAIGAGLWILRWVGVLA
jgi:hypothetical protein